MKPTDPLIITVSRQMGSGGAYIGQRLAKKLKMHYADREIIRKAAEMLAVPEEDLESMDEKSHSTSSEICPNGSGTFQIGV